MALSVFGKPLGNRQSQFDPTRFPDCSDVELPGNARTLFKVPIGTFAVTDSEYNEALQAARTLAMLKLGNSCAGGTATGPLRQPTPIPSKRDRHGKS